MFMKKKHQKHSGVEKIQILRRHLVDKTPVSDICDEYGHQPAVFCRWQKIFIENVAAAFERSCFVSYCFLPPRRASFIIQWVYDNFL